MKIAHFPYGWPMLEMCKALKGIGIDARSYQFVPHEYFKYTDYCLNLQDVSPYHFREKVRNFFISIANDYDVFHLHMMLALTNPLCPQVSDLSILKQLGKKLIVQHHGSEVRRPSLASENNQFYRERTDYIGEENVKWSLSQLSSIFDHAIVHDYELVPYISDYYKNIHVIRHPVDLTFYEPKYVDPNKTRLLVVHAPSESYVKGTDFVRAAVQTLEREGYNFEFKLIENMEYQAALDTYKQADIIIDQLCIGAHGVLSLEAMALGKPVICYIKPDLKAKYPPDLPIVNANPITLHNVLSDLFVSPQKRLQLGIEGRKYVEKYHDSVQLAKELASIYDAL